MKSSNVPHGGLDWMDTDTFLADFLLGEWSCSAWKEWIKVQGDKQRSWTNGNLI